MGLAYRAHRLLLVALGLLPRRGSLKAALLAVAPASGKCRVGLPLPAWSACLLRGGYRLRWALRYGVPRSAANCLPMRPRNGDENRYGERGRSCLARRTAAEDRPRADHRDRESAAYGHPHRMEDRAAAAHRHGARDTDGGTAVHRQHPQLPRGATATITIDSAAWPISRVEAGIRIGRMFY